jgi:hypothetical protein
MEGYLQKLLSESDSAIIHIVDDQFDSSIRSLPEAKVAIEGMRNVRRTKSFNSTVVVNDDTNKKDCHDYFENNGCLEDSQLPENTNTTYNANRVQLSARMEKHRYSRWEASPLSSSQQSISPVPTGKVRSKFSSLHNSLDLEMIPDLTIEEEPQLEAITIVDRAIEDCETIKATRDHQDDYATISDRKRISSLSSSHRFRDDGMTTSHQLVVNKALAISMGEPACKNTRTKINGTTSQRIKRNLPSKLDSMFSPPLVPVRRRSIDRYENEFPVSASFEVPRLLLELPYQKFPNSD